MNGAEVRSAAAASASMTTRFASGMAILSIYVGIVSNGEGSKTSVRHLDRNCLMTILLGQTRRLLSLVLIFGSTAPRQLALRRGRVGGRKTCKQSTI